MYYSLQKTNFLCTTRSNTFNIVGNEKACELWLVVMVAVKKSLQSFTSHL